MGNPTLSFILVNNQNTQHVLKPNNNKRMHLCIRNIVGAPPLIWHKTMHKAVYTPYATAHPCTDGNYLISHPQLHSATLPALKPKSCVPLHNTSMYMCIICMYVWICMYVCMYVYICMYEDMWIGRLDRRTGIVIDFLCRRAKREKKWLGALDGIALVHLSPVVEQPRLHNSQRWIARQTLLVRCFQLCELCCAPATESWELLRSTACWAKCCFWIRPSMSNVRWINLTPLMC